MTTLVLAVGFVLVPLPRLAWATEMTSQSTTPVPAPAGVSFVDPATVPGFDEARNGQGATTAAITPPASEATPAEEAPPSDEAPLTGEPAPTEEPPSAAGVTPTDATSPDDGPTPTDEATTVEDSAMAASAAYSVVIDHDAGDFTTIGVGWAGEVAPTDVILRTRTGDRWDQWHHFAFSTDHRPDDEAAAAIAEPFWVGSADGYEIQYPSALGEPTVHLVREAATQVTLTADEPTAGADPTIRSRSSWGARSPKAIPSTSATLEVAIVHHSVSTNDYSSAQVPGILRSIQAFHMDVRGWNDIAYNFAVDRFGQVWEARAGGIDRTVIGGHAYGFNNGTTGVMVLGTYSSVTPTAASTAAVSDLIAWKFAEHHVPVSGTVTMYPGISTHHGPEGTPVVLDRISGHRNTGQTSCPGTRLHDKLGSIRSSAAARINEHRLSAPPILIGGDRNGDSRSDALVYHPGSRRDLNLNGTAGPDLSVGSTRVSGLYEPLDGDFDGDGIDDVFWYRPGSRADYIWYGKPGGGHRDVATNIFGDYVAKVGDFDGDGADDILWYGDYRANDHVFWGGPGGFTPDRITVNDHAKPLVGDFDADGADDIFWYGYGSRADHLTWGRADRDLALDGTTVSERYEPFVGDFDGDGATDIFWYAPGSGADLIWSGTPARSFSSSSVSVSGVYSPFVGDFDGDTTDDIMWYVAGPAPDYMWLHEGSGRRSESRPVTGTYQTLVVDADGNGRDELLWVADTDLAYLWSRTGGGAHRSSRVN